MLLHQLHVSKRSVFSISCAFPWFRGESSRLDLIRQEVGSSCTTMPNNRHSRETYSRLRDLLPSLTPPWTKLLATSRLWLALLVETNCPNFLSMGLIHGYHELGQRQARLDKIKRLPGQFDERLSNSAFISTPYLILSIVLLSPQDGWS